ncbi:MAG: Ig-like domain-containing protein, partial [Thermoproteota archaeon]|nr:Ig-like domain-containing protein [Thermoproteota archaeon]
MGKKTTYAIKRAISLSLMTALLLSIVNAGISQINPTHNAYGQLLNTPPTADNKNILTNSGTPVTITLTGADPIPGEVLKFSVLALPQHGTLTAPTSNTVTYTPDTGFSGTDSYTYKATDGQGVDSNIATVTITVNAAQNNPPTADNKAISTNAGTPVTITLTGADPIPGDVLKFSVLALPQHGILTSGTTSNSVAYTPNTGFSGTDSYTYKTTDGQGVDSNIATVTITVNAPTPRPTVDNKNILTNSGTPVQITLTGTDPTPGDILKFAVVGNPQHGTITPGTVSSIVFYTPNTGFSGTDSYIYKATDGQGVDSNIATVTITVNASQPSGNNETIQTTSGSNVWSGFGPLGGNILGNPAVGRNADGRLEVFVVGTDHAIYHKFQTSAGSNSWSGFASLGGYLISDPVVGQDADGRLDVFAIGADHAVWHTVETSVSNSNSYSGFFSLGGYILGNPALGKNSDGRLEVFVIGADHALWHIFETAPSSSNSWSGYGNLGGNIISNPGVALNSDGRLEVFVIAANHALHHIFETAASSSNSWSALISLGGYVISDPAVARNSDGRLQVFVIGSDHGTYSISQVAASSSSWSGYGYLGGTITGNTNPAAALNSDGQLQVFVVGPANTILYKFQITPGSSSWTDYASLGGAVISNPVLATNSDNRLDLFVVGSDHALYHNSQLSGSLYDNFEGGKYTLSGGQTSSNGKWLDNFNGLGSAGV